MGLKSQFIESDKANKPRKFLAQKRHSDGLKAPRNSLEIPIEASHGYPLIHEDIPYSCQVKHPSWKMNYYTSETSMKTLIDSELSNRSNNHRNAPGVVARLMDMDTLLSKTKPIIHAKECKDERLGKNITRNVPIEITSTQDMSLSSVPFKLTKQELLPSGTKQDSTQQTRNLRLTKPQPREHPQEELLQKFKKEFEAWQGSKVWEQSRTLELDNNIRQVKDNKILAQEKLNKEKMARCLDSKRNQAADEEPRYYVSTIKPKIASRQGAEGYIRKQSQLIKNNEMVSRSREKANDLAHRLDKKLGRSSSAARIVILKPSSEEANDIEESLDGSSKIREKKGPMEDFIDEVKERLRFEIQGKATARGIGTETTLSERSANPRQIARHIAKQIRENVSRDLGAMLVRSEPTRSPRSEVQFNIPDYPEFIDRDPRKLSSGRPKNARKNVTEVKIPSTPDRRSGTSLFLEESVRLRPRYDSYEMGNKVSCWEDKKALTESKTRSFRSEQPNGVAFYAEAASPGDLVRSYSAPVSRTASRKLRLEDQHVSTAAHIHRKYEASEHISEEVRRKSRNYDFNPKDRVSNIRQNLTLKGKLKKKIQSVLESDSNEFDPMKAFVTTPIVVMDFSIAQDNFTEVPPSPASLSSSSHDEFCRRGHPSPDSPLGVAFREGYPSAHDSEEFISNSPELKSLSEQDESGGSEEATIKGEPYQGEAVEVEGNPDAHAREILLTAVLYEGEVFDEPLSRLDALRPISKWAFEKVEEAYSGNGNVGGHKILSDLVNEALPRVLGASMARSTFKKPVPIPDTTQLLNDLLREMRMYANPQVDESHSVHSMLVWDLRMTPWPSKSHEDIGVMARGVECLILGDLINEFVSDICS